jgi:RpiR family transcriptional regulator, carbohydrate utilization regulator
MPSAAQPKELEPSAMSPRGVLARVHAAYPSLGPQERKLADLLLEDHGLVVRLSIRELASHLGISDATIVRGSQSLGYDGFKALKLAAAHESSPSEWLVREAVAKDDSALVIAKKVFSSDMQAISDTLAVLDEEVLERAVDAILTATRVEFYGAGSSLPVTLDAYYRILRLGLPAGVVTDPHMQATSATHLPRGSLAFTVSYSGQSLETQTTMQRARDAGATVLLLTSYRNTKLGELADIEIVTATPESVLRSDAVSSRIAHLAVVDALSVAIAARHPDSARKALFQDDEIIAERVITP